MLALIGMILETLDSILVLVMEGIKLYIWSFYFLGWNFNMTFSQLVEYVYLSFLFQFKTSGSMTRVAMHHGNR